MTILEKQTYATEFWKPFDNAFDDRFRDSAKQYLHKQGKDDENLIKANDIIKVINKELRNNKKNHC